MDKLDKYTLEELAADFGLTPRTARHYIENVLPPHHKTGRGKLARYGQDTWNCFAFIQKVRSQSGFTAAQLSEVMATLDQAQIDRVAEGREDLRVVTSPIPSAPERYGAIERFRRASERAEGIMSFKNVREDHAPMADIPVMESRSLSSYFSRENAQDAPSWKTLYADEQLRISFKGEASREQREQLDLAAKLMLKILSGKG